MVRVSHLEKGLVDKDGIVSPWQYRRNDLTAPTFRALTGTTRLSRRHLRIPLELRKKRPLRW